MAALREQMLRMSLLKISTPDFSAGYLRGDRQDGHTAAMAIIKSVDQMQIARTAAPGADRQCARKMRFRSRGKGGRFFMAYANPLNVASSPHRVRDAVQRIARNAVDSPDARIRKNLHQQIRYCFLCH